jgi:succinate dehydrogenase / fumarate reductase membrane anchor subunit
VNQSELRTPLQRALGLGSAKEGVAHWWHQRVSAVALVPLSLWFVWVMYKAVGGDFDSTRQLIAHPVHATLMVSYIICLFYHGRLGLQVVIEDYVHHRVAETVLHILSKFAAFLLGAAGVISVLRIAIGG